MSISLYGMGILSGLLIWLDIINIPMYIKKIILALLLVYACICGYYEFPNSVDFQVYKELYYEPASDRFEFPAFEFFGYLDYGFYCLWTVVKSLSGSINDAYFITCAIAMIFYYKGICQYTNYIFCVWSFILVRLYYVSNIVQIRQGLGSAIMIYSFRYIEERNFRMFLICVLISALFHQTFLLTILMYPFCIIKWTKSKCLLAVAVSVLAGLIGISDIIFALSSLIGYGAEKILAYSGSVFFEEFSRVGLMLRLMAIAGFMFYLLKWKKPYANSFVGMLVLGFFFTAIFSSYSVMQRLVNNFLLCMCLLPTYFFWESKKISYRILLIFVIELIFLYTFVKNYIITAI